jgi:hypothetical protein
MRFGKNFFEPSSGEGIAIPQVDVETLPRSRYDVRGIWIVVETVQKSITSGSYIISMRSVGIKALKNKDA